MPFSALQTYIVNNLSHVLWWHWMLMGILSIGVVVFLLHGKVNSLYGAVVLGLVAFVGLVLMDATVLIRNRRIVPHGSGYNIKIGLNRLFHGSEFARAECVSNIAVFIPIGFFLAEFLASLSSKRLGIGRRIGYSVLVGFGLSLCIECLQLILHVGFFELMDLILNTSGAFLGACLSLMMRAMLGIKKI